MPLQNNYIKDYRKLFRLLKDGTVFTAIDTETTGLNSQSDRVIEIGAVKFNSCGVIEKYNTLINPQSPIPFESTQIHNITNDMVKDSPIFDEISREFLDFIGDSILIAHNINFDLRFLNSELTRNEKQIIKNDLIDTLRFARWVFPEEGKYSQQHLAEKLKIDVKNAHRAWDDAFVCGQIFLNLIKESADRQKF